MKCIKLHIFQKYPKIMMIGFKLVENDEMALLLVIYVADVTVDPP